ncbi:hypothetical protein [Halorubellus salinus]|uniref:hypothetical protein n=1 Tax=Halorubellus salinus TaxID=755309 RepID=UPI001D060E5A|nr:hypothetical protein [Halorubellus salinus]
MASSEATSTPGDRYPTNDHHERRLFERLHRSLARRLRAMNADWLPAFRTRSEDSCVDAWESGAIVVFDVGDGIHCRLRDGDGQARHYAGPRRGWIDVKGPTTRDAIEHYGRIYDWKTVAPAESQFDAAADS